LDKIGSAAPAASLNRREALKALAAAGGALAATAFLPGKWAKPLVEIGVLPAHAQGSCPDYQITILASGMCNQSCNFPARYFVDFTWSPGNFNSWNMTFGGVPVDLLFAEYWPIPRLHHEFNPGPGARGNRAVIDVGWENGCRASIEFTISPY
jgi:hypothetical protein